MTADELDEWAYEHGEPEWVGPHARLIFAARGVDIESEDEDEEESE